MEPFWMLYAEGGRGPTNKHTTYELAKEEAERLIREHEAGVVYVLEAVATARPANVIWDEHGPTMPHRLAP